MCNVKFTHRAGQFALSDVRVWEIGAFYRDANACQGVQKSLEWNIQQMSVMEQHCYND